MMTLKMLLVGVDFAGISFALGVTEETVLTWCARATQKSVEVKGRRLRALPATQVQLDELWNFTARKGDSRRCLPRRDDVCASRSVGRLREPVCEPHPMLIYGQLIIQEQPSKLLMLSTALIDRLNLTMRHVRAPLVRVTASVCKDWEPTPRRVVFVQAFCNVAWPHRSLRVPWPEGMSPAAAMIQLQWDHTPVMASGITDQIWNFRELLTVKCKPLDSQSISRCAPKKPAKRIYDSTGLRIVTQYRCGGVRF
jgi:hypothetical protein